MFDNLAVRAVCYFIGSIFAGLAVYNLIMAMTLNVTISTIGGLIAFIIVVVIASLYIYYLRNKQLEAQQASFFINSQQTPEYRQPQPQERYCSTCVYPLRYIEQDNSYYCDYCQKYE